MQFIHRISISSSPDIRSELAGMGIVVGANGLVTFELDEAHGSWPEVQRWIAARRPVDVVSTKFSKQELASARWLELMPNWHHLYPQPEEDVFGYRAATYDLSEFCPQCGNAFGDPSYCAARNTAGTCHSARALPVLSFIGQCGSHPARREAGPSPVQFPVKYEMVVNLKTAKGLGLTMPRSILVRADEIIE